MSLALAAGATEVIPAPFAIDYGYNPLSISDLLFFNSYQTVTPTNSVYADGTTHPSFPGRRITGTAPNMVCNIASAGLTSAYAGGSVTNSGYVNAGNNGQFSIFDAGLSSISYTNPSGTAEPTGVGESTGPAATVLVLGMCSSYTDLKGSFTFSQATLGDMWAVNNTLVPGKSILGCSQDLGRSLTCISVPLAGMLDGSQDFTFFTYFRPTSVNVSGTPTNWMQFTDPSGVTNRVLVSYGAASNGTCTVSSSAGSTTQTGVLSPAVQLNTWQLLAVTHTGTTSTWYIDGVQVATATNGTQRFPSGLDRVTLGGAGTVGHIAVHGAVRRMMTPTELLDLRNWCVSQYA